MAISLRRIDAFELNTNTLPIVATHGISIILRSKRAKLKTNKINIKSWDHRNLSCIVICMCMYNKNISSILLIVSLNEIDFTIITTMIQVPPIFRKPVTEYSLLFTKRVYANEWYILIRKSVPRWWDRYSRPLHTTCEYTCIYIYTYICIRFVRVIDWSLRSPRAFRNRSKVLSGICIGRGWVFRILDL